MTNPAIRFESVSRYFGEVKAVDHVDLEIRDGEFFSMLGPSGSGKTTCLRMIEITVQSLPKRSCNRSDVA